MVAATAGILFLLYSPYFVPGDDAVTAEPGEGTTVQEAPKLDPGVADPSEGGAGEERGDDDRFEFTDEDPSLEGDGPLFDRIGALQDKYRMMREDGTLWELIERTEENNGAAIAFSYILSDVRGALRFGPSNADKEYYSKYVKLMETRFLAEEPLGVNVHITTSDGRVFIYDGDTGESEIK